MCLERFLGRLGHRATGTTPPPPLCLLAGGRGRNSLEFRPGAPGDFSLQSFLRSNAGDEPAARLFILPFINSLSLSCLAVTRGIQPEKSLLAAHPTSGNEQRSTTLNRELSEGWPQLSALSLPVPVDPCCAAHAITISSSRNNCLRNAV